MVLDQHLILGYEFNVFASSCGHRGYFQDKRTGLLQFKEFVRSKGDDAGPLLPSWVDALEIELFLHSFCLMNCLYCDLFLKINDVEMQQMRSSCFHLVSLFLIFAACETRCYNHDD